MAKAFAASVCIWLCAGLAWALHANPWPSFHEPAEGPARAIGEYSAGCLQGAQALPLEGPGYQVMRPSRRRFYGHPELVDFVQKLGAQVHAQKFGVLLVGDLSQPRGGRAPGGHASHQSGLDVDIWYWYPPRAVKGPLGDKQRERMSARSVLTDDGQRMRPEWKGHVQRVLRLSALDPRVDRMFVHPAIKRELCEEPSRERAYLRKVRPWHGHDDHFHARLACPSESADCKNQEPVPEGDGCGDLAFWFDERAQAERREAQKKYQRNVDEGRGWPPACEALLVPPAQAATP